MQLQHSLESQIAALVSNLQVLQQNHDRQQEMQVKEKESKLQQQIEERLKRLEDLQTKMLEAQVCKFMSHLPLGRENSNESRWVNRFVHALTCMSEYNSD